MHGPERFSFDPARFHLHNHGSYLAFVLSGFVTIFSSNEPRNPKRKKNVVVAQKIKGGHTESSSQIDGARRSEAQRGYRDCEGRRNGGLAGEPVAERSNRGVLFPGSAGGITGDVVGERTGLGWGVELAGLGEDFAGRKQSA